MKNKGLIVVYGLFMWLTARNYSFVDYMAAMGCLWLGFYLISGNMVKSLWLTWVGTMLFNKVVYVVNIPDRVMGMNYPYTLFFSDLFLVLTIFYLKWQGARMKYSWNKRDTCLLIITLLSLIATWLAPTYSHFAWYNLTIWVRYLVIFYLAMVIFKNGENIWSTIVIIMVYACFNILLIVAQKINGSTLGWDIEGYFSKWVVWEMPNLFRPSGVLGSPNLMSSVLLMVLPLGSWWLERKAKCKRCLIIFWMVAGVAIFLMASRYVWLLLILMIIMVYRNKNVNFKIPKWWCLGLIGLLPFAIMRWQTLGQGGSLAYRWSHFQMTAEILIKKPWGLGWDMFRYEEVRNYQPEKYFFDPSPQHNLFLEVFSGSGIMGGLIYLWWWWLTAKEVLKGNNFWLKLSIGSYFFVNQMYSSLFSTVITNLFWIVLAIFYLTNGGKIKGEDKNEEI